MLRANDNNVPTVLITGTIETVYPVEVTSLGLLQQNVVLVNVMPVSNSINLPKRILLVTKVSAADNPVPYRSGLPISLKGNFHRRPNDFLSYITDTHDPIGYIRYDGRIYK